MHKEFKFGKSPDETGAWLIKYLAYNQKMARKTMRRKTVKRRTARRATRTARSATRKSGGAKKGGNKWNKFVMGVYNEMKRKDADVSFGDALKEASRLKKKGEY